MNRVLVRGIGNGKSAAALKINADRQCPGRAIKARFANKPGCLYTQSDAKQQFRLHRYRLLADIKLDAVSIALPTQILKEAFNLRQRGIEQ